MDYQPMQYLRWLQGRDTFNKQYPPASNESFTASEQRGQLQANFAGLSQLCSQNVQQYNNDAQEFTRAKFLDNKLPASFSPGLCTDLTQRPITVLPPLDPPS